MLFHSSCIVVFSCVNVCLPCWCQHFHLTLVVFASGIETVRELWAVMSDKLLEAIGLEPDAEIVAIMVDSLCKVSKPVKPVCVYESSLS